MKEINLRIIVISEIVLFCFVFSICANINGEVANQYNIDNATMSSELVLIPELAFEPKFYDFGYVKEGYVYQTTFEIWNKGTDVLDWRLRTRLPWISVYPKSGTSTGEHDIINATINTTGLSIGDYESNVYIHASGDYIFYTYFVVSDAILDYTPKSHDFGYVEEGEILQTSFEIWNNGTSNLEWNVESVKPWMSVNPLSGSSTGEHDIVTVTINTSGLSPGEQSGEINIFSNGGEGYFTISLNVDRPPDKPVINGPSSGKRKTEYTYTFNSVDPDGDDIFYCINWGDNTDDVCIGPYASGETAIAKHTWNTDGTYTLRAKAKDIYDINSDWETFELSISKNKPYINTPFLRFLEKHPNLLPILRQLLLRL